MLQIQVQTPKEVLNPALRKQKLARAKMITFKENLTLLLQKNQNPESEEHHKIILIDFFKKVYYDKRNEVNTKAQVDLVVYEGKTSKSNVSVLIETKKPSNKSEMFHPKNPNVKAFQQLVLYFLREYVDENNLGLKHLIITDFEKWYIFDAQDFKSIFGDKKLVKKYQSANFKTNEFYQKIAQPFIQESKAELPCVAFDFQNYAHLLEQTDDEQDKKLISLYKFLSPDHLLKEFKFDNNQLNRGFYNELLHLMGLEEVKKQGKKIIQRKTKNRHKGSLLENAIHAIQNSGRALGYVESKLFEMGLELCITWVNRVLFLKLLESQLVQFHKGNQDYEFLNQKTIPNFDELHVLFFDVLAKMSHERTPEVTEKYHRVPYLNSSLFDQSRLERDYINIRELDDNHDISYFSQTELRNEKGKKRSGKTKPLTYLFDFLSAYDFSAEGTEEIQEQDKQLISASVLGLIFEKINGYKDGSFFTPSFITMYMSRETLRKAVLQKFNEKYAWNAENLEELEDELSNKKRGEYNQLINSIKICDPAVGSGHFLVSCLNELIAIKSELGILEDKKGRKIKDYIVQVKNDELQILDEEEKIPFEYTVGTKGIRKEKQRLQETLFQEKRTLIENCLFGVDINPNSVKICRLRLWIELLKNAYYTEESAYQNLETLPNIDINIKQGNSLISRFSLDESAPMTTREKRNLKKYKDAVITYKRETSKCQKVALLQTIEEVKNSMSEKLKEESEIEKKINQTKGEIWALKNQADIFGGNQEEKAIKIDLLKRKLGNLLDEKEKLEKSEFFKNAFEWRFEFPEVLNKDGQFVGFDIVIGNPPYIRQEEIKEIKPHLKENYKVFAGTGDILIYFIEKATNLSKSDGYISFIIANKFMRAGFGKKLRHWLKTYQLQEIIDFGDLRVFEEATTYPLILALKNNKKPQVFEALNVETLDKSQDIFAKNRFKINPANLKDDGWILVHPQVFDLVEKIKNQGVPLREYVNNKIFYGIKTGFNEAFVIDEKTKNQLIGEDEKSAEIIKPFLAGRHIKRYREPKTEKYLIFTRRGIQIDNYPAILNYLSQFKKKLKPKPNNYKGKDWEGRKTGNYQWHEIQDTIDYYEEFEKFKIIYPNICKQPEFTLDTENQYTNQKCFIIPSPNKYLLGILNSNLIFFLFKQILPKLRGDFYEPSSVYFKEFPILEASENQQEPIIEKVEKILDLKRENSIADTTVLESEIDDLVYKLYGLTAEEIAIVEGK